MDRGKGIIMRCWSHISWVVLICVVMILVNVSAQVVKKQPYWGELPKHAKVLDSILFGTGTVQKASMAAHNATGGCNKPRQAAFAYKKVDVEWTMDPDGVPGPYMLFVGCTDRYTMYSIGRGFATLALYLQKPETNKFELIQPFFYDSFNCGKGYLLPDKGPFRFKVGKSTSGGFSVREARLIQRTEQARTNEPVWLRDITYTYNVPPNMSVDSSHTFLTDGALGNHTVSAFYGRSLMPTVTFELKGRYLIDRVEVFIRVGHGCGIRHVAVAVDDGKGMELAARNPIGIMPTRKGPENFPGYIAVTNINRPARRVRVDTGSQGGRTCISEIRIFGKKLPVSPLPKLRAEPRIAEERPGKGIKPLNLNYNKLTFSLPHVKWATPFAGKRVSALMLLYGHKQVEAVDLSQRMDLDFTTSFFFLEHPGHALGDYYYWVTAQMMKKELKNALKKPVDVYVISGVMWQQLDDEDRENILDRVKAGVGLIALEPFIDADPTKEEMKEQPKPSPWWEVLPFSRLNSKGRPARGFVGPMKIIEKHPISTGIPYDVLPPMAYSRYEVSGKKLVGAGKEGKDPILAIGNYGKGRLVALSYRVQGAGHGGRKVSGLIPWLNTVTKGEYKYPYWEYHYAWLAKCLIWASGQDFPVALNDIKPTAAQIAQSNLQENAIEAKLKRASYQGNVNAEMTVMDCFGHREEPVRARVSWQQDAGYVRFPLHHLPGGVYIADIIFRDKSGKVLNWGSTSFEVVPAAGILAIDANSEKFFQRSDTARVWVSVEGDKPVLKHALVRIRIEDSFGRLLEDKIYAKGNYPTREKPLELALADMVTSGLIVWAFLLDAEKNVILQNRREFTVGMPRWWDDVTFRMWDTHTSRDTPANITLLRVQLLKEMGVDTMHLHSWMSYPSLYRALEATGMRITYPAGGVSKGGMNLDVSSREFRKKLWDLAEGRAKAFGPFGAPNLIGADEGSYGVGDYKKKPAMVSGFREWLKKEYGAIESLNATWGTTYTNWNEIVPLKQEELPVNNNYAPLSDIWHWCELEYTRIIRHQMEATHAGCPEMRFGLSGSQQATPGSSDWTSLSHAMDTIAGYSGPQVLQRRSFNPELKEVRYIGPAGRGDSQRRNIWEKVMNGAVGYVICNGNPKINPDYSLPQGAIDIEKETALIKSGPGKILINADRIWDPVAIHYSQRSVHAAFAIGLCRKIWTEWINIEMISKELGLQPKYVSSLQILQGELAEGKYKFLFMPWSYAISAKEAKAIRTWVESGGVVFATAGTGAMDGRCRVMKKGMLDDLFGIRRGNFEIVEQECYVTGICNAEGITVKDKRLLCTLYEPNISAGPGAQVLAKIEETDSAAIVVNQVGKGLAIYCSADVIGTYSRDRDFRCLATTGPLIDAQELLVESALKRAGVVADTAVVDRNGKRMPHFATYQYEFDGMPVIGFIGSSKAKTVLHLGAKGFVFEMLSGKSYGKTDRVEFSEGTPLVTLFAILPYEVTGIAINLPTKVVQGTCLEAQLAIQCKGPVEPRRHILRVELVNPSGEVLKYYTENLVAEHGSTGFRRKLALNEAPGTWTLRVRDVATGTTHQKTFVVQGNRSQFTVAMQKESGAKE